MPAMGLSFCTLGFLLAVLFEEAAELEVWEMDLAAYSPDLLPVPSLLPDLLSQEHAFQASVTASN